MPLPCGNRDQQFVLNEASCHKNIHFLLAGRASVLVHLGYYNIYHRLDGL